MLWGPGRIVVAGEVEHRTVVEEAAVADDFGWAGDAVDNRVQTD